MAGAPFPFRRMMPGPGRLAPPAAAGPGGAPPLTLTRRLLLLVLLALLPPLAVEAYNQLELRREREREVAAAAVRQAERLAAEERRVIDGVRQVLATLVELPEVRGQDAAACDALFAAIRPHH